MLSSPQFIEPFIIVFICHKNSNETSSTHVSVQQTGLIEITWFNVRESLVHLECEKCVCFYFFGSIAALRGLFSQYMACFRACILQLTIINYILLIVSALEPSTHKNDHFEICCIYEISAYAFRAVKLITFLFQMWLPAVTKAKYSWSHSFNTAFCFSAFPSTYESFNPLISTSQWGTGAVRGQRCRGHMLSSCLSGGLERLAEADCSWCSLVSVASCQSIFTAPLSPSFYILTHSSTDRWGWHVKATASQKIHFLGPRCGEYSSWRTVLVN